MVFHDKSMHECYHYCNIPNKFNCYISYLMKAKLKMFHQIMNIILKVILSWYRTHLTVQCLSITRQ